MDFDHHEETYIVDPVDTSSKNLPSILKDGYDNDNSSCSSMDTSSNIIAKIKALPGVKKDQIKDMINLASTVSEHSQPRRRRPRIRKRDPSQVPRPMNCFLTYRLEKQKQIATICPGANHREISKIVAKWWSQESDEEKKKYRVVAEKDKQLHREK
ncbi:high mobility group box domain-containing protein [Phascolomyces articulosus]|uniref:High mobility group box domain-containing protein n=1 Tax=Phascolomyces articulosus TaxID=60185 RepID=A0AAD5PCB6_9FUNG|nr:high mobility group box domain-containing protein [Phascolomyces articulosus]